MIPTYVLMASDKWFRFDDYVKDNNGEIYWYISPKRMAINDRVFVYLAGKSKAIKYEGVITQVKDLTMSTLPININKYLIKEEVKFETGKFGDQAMFKMKITKIFNDLEDTSLANMREHGVRGMFMSNRELKPPTVIWLDSIKNKSDL